jgi:hypothetical protein
MVLIGLAQGGQEDAMERAADYKFRLGQRVVARGSSRATETGIIVSRRFGLGTPAYTVHFGQGRCLILNEEQMLLVGQ